MIAGIVRSISVALLGGLVLVLLACGTGFNFGGTWKGNRNIPPLPGERPGVAYTLGHVNLKIDGGRFEMTEAGIKMDGTVRYGDGKAYLKVESRLNVPIANEPKDVQEQYGDEIVLTPRQDGKLDFFDPNGFFEKPVALERVQE